MQLIQAEKTVMLSSAHLIFLTEGEHTMSKNTSASPRLSLARVCLLLLAACGDNTPSAGSTKTPTVIESTATRLVLTVIILVMFIGAIAIPLAVNTSQAKAVSGNQGLQGGWVMSNNGDVNFPHSFNLQISYSTFKGTPYVKNAYWFNIQDIPEALPSLSFGLQTGGSASDTYLGVHKPSFSTYQQYANY
jgi:hypothetical protein